MVAERAGYTVTMFVVDVSSSMASSRIIQLPDEERTIELSSLQWSLQYVMYKIQEMIFHGRKTEQCGVMLFGSQETNNIVNTEHGGYENVSLYVPIAQPNAGTLAKLNALRSSSVIGDPLDGLIAAIETQARYLATKSTWTRKMVLVTDGENPLEVEHWEETAAKMKQLDIKFSILGVDFDDEEFEFEEKNKSVIKRENERFWHEFAEKSGAIVGSCAFALQEVMKPEPKEVKSAALSHVLRVGDVEADPETSIEIAVKSTKGTAAVRPASLKKFAKRELILDEDGVLVPPNEAKKDKDKDTYSLLRSRTDYVLAKDLMDQEENAMEADSSIQPLTSSGDKKQVNVLAKETLTRCYKYGATWVDVEDEFLRLETKKGIDICAFFPAANLRRELLMSEVQFLWADPASGKAQVAFSSIVQAMDQQELVAVSRWVNRDGSDPKMGLLIPRLWGNIESLSWVQVPFADDLRKYIFPSLDTLVSKNGEHVSKHPHLPTSSQMQAMDEFVDAMDLMHVGEKDENGHREPWFDPSLSYNPAVHRIKQAAFHAAIVPDLLDHPVPPPHQDLIRYFEPPSKLLKRAHDKLDLCLQAFDVKSVQKVSLKRKAEQHVEAVEDDGLILGPSKRIRGPTPLGDLPSGPTNVNSKEHGPIKSAKTKSEGSDKESEVDETTIAMVDGPNDVSGQTSSLAGGTNDGDDIPIDRGLSNGRIVGTAYPLEDFKRNLAVGDLVSKAVEDLAAVIQEIALQPFSRHRHDELLDCLKELRGVCLHEDEIYTWNECIRELKDVCLSSSPPSNHALWQDIQRSGMQLGLITKGEAAKAGGKSAVSETAASKFMR